MKLITTHPIKKSDLGLHNNLFGGKLLAWIDAAGAAFTTEYVDSPRLVTVMIDKCIFKKPAKEGQLLLFPAHLPHRVDINRSKNTRISISFNIIRI